MSAETDVTAYDTPTRTHARLVDTTTPRRPRGVALVLHGGAARQRPTRVSPTQLSVLRMVPVAGRLAVAGRGELAVQRLLNSSRGWDAEQTPVDDVRWALRQVAERWGADVPVCLVGHSLGGRAALLAAGADQVVSAVALNPWLHPTEGRIDLTGRDVLLVHGDEDRVAPRANAAAVARDLARTARVGFVTVSGAKHAMLRRGHVFERLAADFAVSTLLHRPATGTVARVLAGEGWLDA
ncbi:alpha/beta hydrolase [Terrabacter aeriphilus]|uniref:Alpha/beta hydrolase n=1 Tax=Terrabacter aeriphilus TaxID=515662 RepID=A0ABP9JKT6_9MICO